MRVSPVEVEVKSEPIEAALMAGPDEAPAPADGRAASVVGGHLIPPSGHRLRCSFRHYGGNPRKNPYGVRLPVARSS